MNGYPFTNELNSFNFEYEISNESERMAYILVDYKNNTMEVSDPHNRDFFNSKQHFGLVLSINYSDFLNYLNQNNLIVKTHINKNGLQYEFLSFPDTIASKTEEDILNKIYNSNGEIKEIGKIINNGNKYHIGNCEVYEFDVYLKQSEKKNYVRMIMKDGKYHWVNVNTLFWNVDKKNNILYTDNIVLPFDGTLKKDIPELTDYINNVLYYEMNYHPEQYISNNLKDIVRDIICIKQEMYRNKDLLNNENSNEESKIMR